MSWRLGVVAAVRDESATARTISLQVAEFPAHLAGQHIDVRLTAEDGYSAVRSYSIASPAGVGDRLIEITIERVPDGEVSSDLAGEVTPGDQLEVRGPVGGWFVWRPAQPDPVQLVAGGSGIVPLMSMVRTHAAASTDAPMRALYSTRSPASLIYRGELAGVDVVYTRGVPDGWPTGPHRIGAADLAAVTITPELAPTCYICGPTPFVETAAELFLAAGHPAAKIRTERFGAGGGG
ncbi:MAG: ferredoxin reductase [Jatrophihabitans sp.]